MERAYYVDVVDCQFVVMSVAPGEAPTIVGGPFWTAIAAWKDAEHRAAESGASSICYTTAPGYVPRTEQSIRGAWVVRRAAARPQDILSGATPAPGRLDPGTRLGAFRPT